MDFVQRKVDAAQIPVGYASAAAVGSTPVWVQGLSGWLELFAVLFAVLVGATTLYMNLQSIMEKRKRGRHE